MMELEELKHALNWDGVIQGSDCFVIHFTMNDIHKINGIRSNGDCYHLGFPEFQKNLISFLITDGDEMFQYWVLGDRLHRANGPARIYHHSIKKTSQISYFDNGLLHNDGGPAELVLTNHYTDRINPLTMEEIPSTYIIDHWDEMQLYWFTRGEPSLYPKPHSAVYTNGYRVFDTEQKPQSYDNLSGFYAKTGMVNWKRGVSLTEIEPFRVRYLKFDNYRMDYSEGKFVKHSCDNLTTRWISNGNNLEVKNPKINRTLKTDLFERWNLWNGPFFSDTQEEMFTYQEVMKDNNDDE